MFKVYNSRHKNADIDSEQENDSKDFFGKETNLTVSGQLEAESYAMGLGKCILLAQL